MNINELVPNMQILEHMPLEKRHYSFTHQYIQEHSISNTNIYRKNTG